MGDYRKLWENLNMDLEKHDLLCEPYQKPLGQYT